ncbi:hypothetical protein [Nocardia fluminea]|uniref:hypothetical protein n=1 Tax=Nocardia fluminea TaxID=134984 RepID=UPI00364FE0C3
MSTLYEVLLFDLTNPSGAPVPQQVGEFESYVNSVAFNADGSTLAAGSSDNSVHLFDIRAGGHALGKFFLVQGLSPLSARRACSRMDTA